MPSARAASVVLVLLACGQPKAPPCTAESCSGCCSGTQCLPGSANNACGAAGQACQTCTMGELRISQGCQATSPQCGAASCSGCCANNACQAGTAASACGTNGAVCQDCGAAGSCTALGQCEEPDAGGDAGVDGGADGGPLCGGQSCAGCCSSGICVPFSAQSASECGAGGAACGGCSAGQQCDAGVCQTGACGACTGCCSGSICLTPTAESNAACGASGMACVDCSLSGQYCGHSAHACTSAGTGGLGSACAGDSACAPGAHTGEPWCQAWPTGYCEDSCDTLGSSPGPCPDAGYCLGIFGSLGGGDSLGLCLIHCSGSCANAADLCDPTVGDGKGYCLPKCGTAQDCASFFGNTHAQCVAATGQCCGITGFACCSGSTCLDGSTCQSASQRCK